VKSIACVFGLDGGTTTTHILHGGATPTGAAAASTRGRGRPVSLNEPGAGPHPRDVAARLRVSALAVPGVMHILGVIQNGDVPLPRILGDSRRQESATREVPHAQDYRVVLRPFWLEKPA